MVHKKFYGYAGRWALVNLSTRGVEVKEADPELYRLFIGGRGVQAYLIYQHLKRRGPLRDPLSAENRIVIGNSSLNDTAVPTAGRGSCSFISPFTYSPAEREWLKRRPPIFGLLTHSSCGGLFPNMLKRAGFDQIIIDGRADWPVRLLVFEGKVEIIEAEPELFEEVNGRKVLRRASETTDFLSQKYPGSSTVCPGPAGWNQVAFACLTNDYHRNFGRGGAGAVFGSKNLVAITAYGRELPEFFDRDKFLEKSKVIDESVNRHVHDPNWTASFRPETGTTWWLDRAFHGGYLGKKGGYLPWHNFDEGYFDPELYRKVSTAAFLEIAGKHKVCNRCRHILCTRSAAVNSGPFAHTGVRPEFETIALWINCCLTDRDGIFYLNHLCNEFGIDTMTFGSVMAGAMELREKGLWPFSVGPEFGHVQSMMGALEDIVYQRNELGRLLARPTDLVIDELVRLSHGLRPEEVVRCLTTAYAGLGYAGIEPKVFPGMFAAYATSNRGRGDHTYAWTIQAEEGGLSGAENLAAYVAGSQIGKALTDSLGLCDFFTEDFASPDFLELYRAATGIDYTADSLKECGRRIYTLERYVNNMQGRSRQYDEFVPPKFTEPLTAGPQAGKAVAPAYHQEILDAYYRQWRWTNEGLVPAKLLEEYGIEKP
ncbi:MAG: aldehyde ferredoxin oxidoreductase C-terminal domain-containing protein [Candidatus Saccharicenans sp.]